MMESSGQATRGLLAIVWILLVGVPAFASADRNASKDVPYSPYVGKRHPTRVYWGDTHVHTNLSADGNLAGNTDVGPEDAYRFARGEEVVSQSGQRAKLGHPLDFVVLSDHAEGLGLLPLLREGDERLLALPRWRRIHESFASDDPLEIQKAAWELGSALMERGEDLLAKNPELGRELTTEAWGHQIRLAEQFNDPGVFSAMIGFEYSPTARGSNLHRNVIFRDGADRTGRILPFSAADSLDVEDLWKFMARYEEETGGRVLAIPHNANISNGTMFATEDSSGHPIDAEYATTRARWEPLFEVTQIKGDQESHPTLSPEDEFAGFEIFDKTGSFGVAPKEDWMLKHEYARAALGLGLQIAQRTGANPYRFGMIGSSDTHTGLAGSVAEDDFWGKGADMEPGLKRTEGVFMPARIGEEYAFLKAELGASGLAAVWAEENTREALFDAMQRREVYATTGSRITLRFFGGWSYETEDAAEPHLALVGYAKGVPMGSMLGARPDGADAPSFLLAALKDPEGPNLDRIQIVKGWIDEDGHFREQVFDVGLSDGRRVGPDGKAPRVGSTVDIERARFANTIGAAELTSVWTDPDFDEELRTFYYARVIEIPRPRWSTLESAFFGSPRPEGVPTVVQDRAYSSPIWYSPGD